MSLQVFSLSSWGGGGQFKVINNTFADYFVQVLCRWFLDQFVYQNLRFSVPFSLTFAAMSNKNIFLRLGLPDPNKHLVLGAMCLKLMAKIAACPSKISQPSAVGGGVRTPVSDIRIPLLPGSFIRGAGSDDHFQSEL